MSSAAVDYQAPETPASPNPYDEFGEKFHSPSAPTTPPSALNSGQHQSPSSPRQQNLLAAALSQLTSDGARSDDSISINASNSSICFTDSELSASPSPASKFFSPSSPTPPHPFLSPASPIPLPAKPVTTTTTTTTTTNAPTLPPLPFSIKLMATWPRGDRTLQQLKEHVAFLSTYRWGEYDQWTGFDAEFRDLELQSHADLTAGDFTSASLPQNRMKNRYFNVLPVESTRVKLGADTSHLFGSDYVNASYIDGKSGPKTYIACQGCMKETIADFWAMVWSENSNIIVMLTNVEEGDRPKCYKYWNNSGKEKAIVLGTARLFTVLLLEFESASPGLLCRKLLLTNCRTGEARKIHHFQFVDWPDHGIPHSTASFRHLLRLVDAIDTTGPIVVHCSAGIGRTGTFCTAHICLHRAQSTSPPLFDILGTVQRIRKERPGMVQTKDQYMFCYLAVLEEFLEREKESLRFAASHSSPCLASTTTAGLSSSSSSTSSSSSPSSSSSSSSSSYTAASIVSAAAAGRKVDPASAAFHHPYISSAHSAVSYPIAGQKIGLTAADLTVLSPTDLFGYVSDPYAIPSGFDDPGTLPPYQAMMPPADVPFFMR